MLEFLKSQTAILVVLALALIAQIPHASAVFIAAGQISGWFGITNAYAYAIALELAVLLFVVQGRKKESYAFAAFSIFINLAYYSMYFNLFTVAAIPCWLISFGLPIAIALYSHSLKETPKANVLQLEAKQLDDLQIKAQELRNEGKTLTEIAAIVDRSTSWVSRNTTA